MKKNGLTEQRLAERIGRSRSTVACYKAGLRSPDKDTLSLLATVLNVSVDYLLGRTDDPAPSIVREDVISFRTDGLTKADKEDLRGYFDWLREKRKREQQKGRDNK